MSTRVSRDKDRALLDQELCGGEYRELLARIQAESGFLVRFGTWGELVAFMRNAPAGDLAKDDVLRPILEAHFASEDHRWQTVLLAIFWPALESIHWCRRKWDRDSDQRWQNVLWAFVRGVSALDVNQRKERLFEKLYAETARQLYRQYDRLWEWKDQEILVDPQDLAESDQAAEDLGLTALERHEEYELALKRIHEHFVEGHIKEQDFVLLMGTRVYGKSLVDYCRETGMSHAAARKRRSRAEAIIRDHEKKLGEK